MQTNFINYFFSSFQILTREGDKVRNHKRSTYVETKFEIIFELIVTNHHLEQEWANFLIRGWFKKIGGAEGHTFGKL